MPDITMCSGEGCVLKEICFRYKCIPNSHQSYFVKPPFGDVKCDEFLNITEGQNKYKKNLDTEKKNGRVKRKLKN